MISPIVFLRLVARRWIGTRRAILTCVCIRQPASVIVFSKKNKISSRFRSDLVMFMKILTAWARTVISVGISGLAVDTISAKASLWMSTCYTCPLSLPLLMIGFFEALLILQCRYLIRLHSNCCSPMSMTIIPHPTWVITSSRQPWPCLWSSDWQWSPLDRTLDLRSGHRSGKIIQRNRIYTH